MDPFSLLVLASGALGMAVASSSSREADDQRSRKSLFDMFHMVRWHFAMSFDWDPFFYEVVTGPDLEEAQQAIDNMWLSENVDPEDDRIRTYAIVRGGRAVSVRESSERLAPGILHVVWQAEQDIHVISIDLIEPMTLEGALRLAWREVPESSDVRIYADSSHMPFDEPIEPDMVVIGGEVVYVGSLR